MHLLPNYASINSLTFFGLVLILGLIGGRLAKYTRFLPQISGYIAVGYLIGPHGFNIIQQSSLADISIFINISVGLVLFNLGRQLDFTWLRYDPSLLGMSLLESGLTFSLIFLILYLLGLGWLPAVTAATIAIATSPAVIMMVASDLNAQGPVTRRILILTSMNNFIAISLFAFLLPITKMVHLSEQIILWQAFFRLLASMGLGILLFLIIKCMAYLIGKQKEGQFILIIGAAILTIGLTEIFNLSSMLALFTLGVAARNFDCKHRLVEINFGWLARLFFVMLFVVVGIHLQLQGLWQATAIVLLFIIIRLLAKAIGIFVFAKSSRLTRQQTIAISLALMPMAGVAIDMSNTLKDFNPELGYALTSIIAAVVTLLNILGPIATQLALLKSGEALPEAK